MVKVKGLEPLLHRPKRRVLPLHYTLMVLTAGLEPATPSV